MTSFSDRPLQAAAAAILALALTAAPAGANTRCVQEFLSGSAFDPGPVDGLWGRKTAAAASAFLRQVDADGQFDVSKSTAGSICAFMTGERREELVSAARYRVYAIEIDLADLPESVGRTRFDFSSVQVDQDLNATCSFAFRRKPKEQSLSETMARGQVKVEGGFLVFDDLHSWRTRGLSDPSYLIEEANLAVQKDGMVVGKTPYFHLFINPGEIALQPKYVELAFKHVPREPFPSGQNWFYVDDWQDAFLELRCRDSGNG